MDVNMINPILAAFAEVLPQIGFQKIEKKGLSLTGTTLHNNGVLLNIALLGQLKGIIMIGMDTESAKRFASKMMMGMEVTELDSLAQSAVSEMGNMVCANACTQFSKIGLGGLDISPPTLMIGDGVQATLPVPQIIVVKFCVDGIDIQVYIGLMS
jgi:chemotaxis protein CheX